MILVTVFSIFQAAIFADDVSNGKLKEGDHIETYSLQDQHEVVQELKKDTKTVIFSFGMDLSKKFHKLLKSKDNNYLANNKTEYIIDIRGMPSLITWLFAGPKMRKYGFPILLVKEGDFPEKFPSQEDKFTILKLDEKHSITEISFIDDINKVISIIEQ